MEPVKVVPYDPKWPEMFALEAQLIKRVLKKNCTVVHHVGSTSIPGMAAKPKIDIIAVVKDSSTINSALESIGYLYKGEYNIPFHSGFSKREPHISVNLHVYEEENPEIILNLLFRDYLRSHIDAFEEYAHLKSHLIDQPSSHQRQGRFSGYNLGKDQFIKKTLKKAGFKELCLRFCTHHDEWEAAQNFRQHYFLTHLGITDPYPPSFGPKDQIHFVFYQGTEIVGYAHIQLLDTQKAKLNIFIIDDSHLGMGFEKHFLPLCKRWLDRQGLHLISNDS